MKTKLQIAVCLIVLSEVIKKNTNKTASHTFIFLRNHVLKMSGLLNPKFIKSSNDTIQDSIAVYVNNPRYLTENFAANIIFASQTLNYFKDYKDYQKALG